MSFALRPMSLGDIFDEAFDLYKRQFAFLVLVFGLTAIPVAIGWEWATRTYPETFSFLNPAPLASDPGTEELYGWLNTMVGLSPLSLIAYAVAYSLPVVALINACAARYLGGAITLREAYIAGLRRLFGLLAGAAIFGFCLMVGNYLCGLAVIFPIVWFPFSAYAFVCERKSFIRAFGRSYQLISGQAVQVFGTLCILATVCFVIVTGVQATLNFLLGTLVGLLPGAADLPSYGLHSLASQHQIIEAVCRGLALLICVPYVIATLTVLYFDVRVRKEAFDIEQSAVLLGYPPLASIKGVLPPALIMPPQGVRPQASRFGGKRK